MQKYKFTLTYIVPAKTKTDAIEILATAFKLGTSLEYREYEMVKEVLTEKSGWASSFKKQITG